MGFLDKIMDTMHLGGDYDDDYDDYDDDDYEEDRPKKGIFKKKEKEYDYDMEDDVVTESGKVRPIKQQSRITPMRSRKTRNGLIMMIVNFQLMKTKLIHYWNSLKNLVSHLL